MAYPARFLDQQLRMQQMRLLLTLEKSRSLSGSARILGLSQPALTKQLRGLEEAIGESLFERHAHGVTPTPVGELLIRYAGQTLSDLTRLEDDLDRLANPGRGLVVLGAFPVAAAGLLPPVVRAVRARHPDLEIRLEEGRVDVLLPKLMTGELDMVLGRLYEPPLPDGLLREPLYSEPISLFARSGHPIFEAGGADRSPAAWGLLLPTFSQRIGQEIEHFIASRGLDVGASTIRSASQSFVREMLLETDMLAIAPRLMMAGGLRRGTLRVIGPDQAAPARPGGVILNATREIGPTSRLVLTEIRTAIAALTSSATSGILGLADPGATPP